MFTLQEQGLNGLGLVVKVTSEFDPVRMKERYRHWLGVIVNEIAGQAREEIRSGKMKVVENDSQRRVFMRRAVEGMTPIKSTYIGPTFGTNVFKSPSKTKMYIKSVATLAIGYVLPWVGFALAISQMFGPKKKMALPWNSIFTQAIPYARQIVEQEEIARIQEEKARIESERRTEIKRQSEQATQFKMPEGVTRVTKGGVLMIQPKGGPTEVRK